ncbi:MAG TPA: hypothetical protein VF752_14495 [Thermoleophilaceae bacterium]
MDSGTRRTRTAAASQDARVPNAEADAVSEYEPPAIEVIDVVAVTLDGIKKEGSGDFGTFKALS